MKMYRETTKWTETDVAIPNHTYILESGRQGAKCLGYIREGYETPYKFKKPLTFDKRRRTFQEVKNIPAEIQELFS